MALKRHISIRHLKSSYKVRIELVELEFQQAQSNVQTTFPYLLDVEIETLGRKTPQCFNFDLHPLPDFFY